MTLSPLETGLIISLFISVIALMTACISLYFLRRNHALTEKIAERLSHEIALSTTGTVNMGQRLIALEKRLFTGEAVVTGDSQKTETKKVDVQKTNEPKINVQPVDAQPLTEQQVDVQATVAQKIDTANLENVTEEYQPYSQAAELFKSGIDCDEVARRCGLSRAEASLIQTMQVKASV